MGISTAEKPKKLEVPRWSIRLASAEDMPFLYESWLRSWHNTYPNRYDADFFVEARAKAGRILQSSVVGVAHVEGEPNELLGYVVFGKWRKSCVVHYAFVKADARKHGVFRSLVAFANFEKFPVLLTAPAQNEDVMKGLMKHAIYDQQVLPLMLRGGA
jgi:hypothetical protein